MAEAIGLAASIAGLVQLTGAITIVAHGYIGSVKRANKDRSALLEELNSLNRVLILLQDDVKANGEQSPALQQLDSEGGFLKGCFLELEELKSQLKPKVGLKGSINRLKWPLGAGECKEHIEKIERFKSAINTALGIDNRTLLREIKADIEGAALTSQDNGILSEAHSRSMNLAIQDIRAQTGIEGKRKTVLDWLYSGDCYAKNFEISHRRQKGTGEWLLREPEFVGWANGNQKSRLLWGHGIPGAGKTFLSSAVIDHFEATQSAKRGLAHFYFEYKEQIRHTPTQVLSSLAKQLASQITGLPAVIEGLYDKLNPAEKRPTLDELYDTIIAVSRLFEEVFFVFDALDECDPERQRRALLPLFQRMSNDGINVFLTSRPHPEDIKDCLHEAVKIELSAQKEDIAVYVNRKIDGNARARGLVRKGKCRERIISELVACAKGMFLLVHFHIEYLCQQTTVNQILDALENLGRSSMGEKSLYPTYDKAMDSILRQPEGPKGLAFNTLSWLVKARRVLTIDEIRTAVSVEPNRYELDDMDLPDIRTLLDVCGGLAIIDEHTDTIRLAHYTVQEYLLERSVLPDADFKLVVACTTYLSFDIFARPVASWSKMRDRFQLYPLFQYASQMLVPHLRACNQELSTGFFLGFLKRAGNVESYNEVQYYENGYRHEGTLPLHIASGVGHIIAVQRLIKAGAGISVRDSQGRMPLHVAASEGQEAVVSLLLRERHRMWTAADRDQRGWTALHEAANGGHEGVVRLLLKKRLYPPWIRIYTTVDDDRQTALHLAAQSGSEAVVKVLLDRGADLSTVDGSGRTALHQAAERGYEAVVKLLLDKGADLSTVDGSGSTALHLAAEEGHEAVVKLLLDKGADLSTVDSSGRTALHLAAEWGRGVVVKLLLDKGADLSTVNSSGRTALHQAAERGHEEVVKLLLDKGVDLSTVDGSGSTALHWAAESGREAVVKLLLDKGADLSTVDGSGRTALHLAAKRAHEAVVKLLLDKGADLSTVDGSGRTALHWAVIYGREAVVMLLLDKGVDLSTVDGSGRTALHLAAEGGHEAVVKLLLDKGVDLSTVDGSGRTALHWAAEDGREAVVKLLLDKGADLSTVDGSGRTALHWAVIYGREAVVMLLLDKGADLSTVDGSGRTALHCAAEYGREAVVKLLLDKGADLSTVDSSGRTALHLAAEYGCEAVVKLLLDKGVDLSTVDSSGRTALHLAAEYGCEAVVKLLLDKGVDLSTVDVSGRTALHLAAENESEEVVELLLDKGVDLSAKDNMGKTALDLARASGCDTVVKLLLEAAGLPASDSTGIKYWVRASTMNVRKLLRR